jgi:hypothetical protein
VLKIENLCVENRKSIGRAAGRRAVLLLLLRPRCCSRGQSARVAIN